MPIYDIIVVYYYCNKNNNVSNTSLLYFAFVYLFRNDLDKTLKKF